MEDNILISVIIPVYNVSKYLQGCINSLVNQTMAGIEYIFINDASLDNCIDILRANQEKYPEIIKVIDLKENLNQGGAKNKGMEIARGKYVGFCDSDDFIANDMYEVLYKSAENTGADVTYIQYTAVPEDAVVEDEIKKGDHKPLNPFTERHIDISHKKTLDDEDRMYLMCNFLGANVCTLWNREFLNSLCVKFPEHIKYEDNYFGMITQAFVNKISCIDEVKYFYRQNSNSTVNKRNATHHYDRIVIENMVINEFRKRGILDRYKDALEYIYTYRYAMRSLKLFLKGFDFPDWDKIRIVAEDLNREFPDFKKNRFYNELIEKSERREFEWQINHIESFIKKEQRNLRKKILKLRIKSIVNRLLGEKKESK